MEPKLFRLALLLDGDTSRLKGDKSKLFGSATLYGGNLNDCDLSESKRKKGIPIEDLVGV